MLENKAAEPGFWDNMEAAQKVPQENGRAQAEGRDVREALCPCGGRARARRDG